MKITYLQVFEGRFGPKTLATKVMDFLDFAFLLTFTKNKNDEDTLYEVEDEVFVNGNKYPILFWEAISTNNASRILASLNMKGYWVGGAEEGTFGFALEGKEKECKAEILRVEAQIEEECW